MYTAASGQITPVMETTMFDSPNAPKSDTPATPDAAQPAEGASESPDTPQTDQPAGDAPADPAETAAPVGDAPVAPDATELAADPATPQPPAADNAAEATETAAEPAAADPAPQPITEPIGPQDPGKDKPAPIGLQDAKEPAGEPDAATPPQVAAEPRQPDPGELAAAGEASGPVPDVEPIIAHLRDTGTGQTKCEAVRDCAARAENLHGFLVSLTDHEKVPGGTYDKIVKFIRTED